MIRHLVKDVFSSGRKGTKVKAKVVLMNKSLLDLNDINAAIINQIQDFLGQKVEFRLVSATVGDPSPFFIPPLSYKLICFLCNS